MTYKVGDMVNVYLMNKPYGEGVIKSINDIYYEVSIVRLANETNPYSTCFDNLTIIVTEDAFQEKYSWLKLLLFKLKLIKKTDSFAKLNKKAWDAFNKRIDDGIKDNEIVSGTYDLWQKEYGSFMVRERVLRFKLESKEIPANFYVTVNPYTRNNNIVGASVYIEGPRKILEFLINGKPL